jgi:hypothetical protein
MIGEMRNGITYISHDDLDHAISIMLPGVMRWTNDPEAAGVPVRNLRIEPNGPGVVIRADASGHLFQFRLELDDYKLLLSAGAKQAFLCWCKVIREVNAHPHRL